MKKKTALRKKHKFANLHTVLKARHITKKALACEMGMPPEVLSEKLFGVREFTMYEMFRICRFLEGGGSRSLPMDWLFQENSVNEGR